MSDSWTSRGIAGLDLYVEAGGAGRRASLEESLRTAIQRRRLTAGATLPSTRALAKDLNLSRGTVVAAYDQLVAEGYLLARQGGGTEVADLGPANLPAEDPRPAKQTRLDLRPGTPDVTSFPVAEWLRCTRRALGRASASAYGYGDLRGRFELRRALIDYLGRTRGVQARPEQVLITAGATQALSLLCSALAEAGSANVAMENPGFNFHHDVVRHAGLRLVPMRVDERGADDADIGDADAAVLTPAHQYPTGVTMHPSRRRAFTTWARTGNGLIVEDDYDGEFRYDRQPIGALQGTAADHVVYIGTASKTLGPGLRLGWMVLPDRLVPPVMAAKQYTDLSTDAIAQLTLAELISSHGYDRHIRTMRLRYRRRRDLLINALERVRPQLVTGISAGLQALVRLPEDGPNEGELVRLAASEGLWLEGLGPHWHGDRPYEQGLIIGFSRPSEGAYPAAVSLLVRVLRRAFG
jgi:GntR family transcriptional regulator / MocR family aminotransferase